MLGAVIGDIVGSVYETNNIKTKDFPLFSKHARITDDSVCTIAVAEALITRSSVKESLRRWGLKYKDIKNPPGFFPDFFSGGFTKWLESENARPYGAKSNGALMRLSPVPFLIRDLKQALTTATDITNLTHNHPEAVSAAQAYVRTIHLCQKGARPFDIKNMLAYYYGYDMKRSVDEIRPSYRFFTDCQKCLPEAVLCALEATSFEDALRNAVSLGGDSDTLACITGAIAEARFGIPDSLKSEAEKYIPAPLKNVLNQMYQSTAAVQITHQSGKNPTPATSDHSHQ